MADNGEPVQDLAGAEPFAYVAEARLLSALGRASYAFMCLRWEALWLFDAVAQVGSGATDRLARADTSVVALRLQSAAAEVTLEGLQHEQLRRWCDDFADCADGHAEVQSGHPGSDGIFLAADPEADRPPHNARPLDLLGFARRYEALALEGRVLRRQITG